MPGGAESRGGAAPSGAALAWSPAGVSSGSPASLVGILFCKAPPRLHPAPRTILPARVPIVPAQGYFTGTPRRPVTITNRAKPVRRSNPGKTRFRACGPSAAGHFSRLFRGLNAETLGRRCPRGRRRYNPIFLVMAGRSSGHPGDRGAGGNVQKGESSTLDCTRELL